MPKGSAEPGPWRTSRTPYAREISLAAVDPKYKRVVIVMGAQMGKTECILNIVGHRLDDDPAPTMMVFPTQKLATSVSKSRLMPMIRSTPSLFEKLDKRKTSNQLTEKYIGGQRLGLAWAGSATELSSHPAVLIVIDELDRMAVDVSGEGDPVTLAEARTTTFADGRVIVASTPTLEGASPIWSLYEQGTMHTWTIPCPDCETYFAPSFDLLKWPEKSTPAAAKRDARLTCPHCGVMIEDRHRNSMNAAGRFAARGDPESDTASFWVSGLASPWRTWGDAAKAWLEAARSREGARTQAVMNTVFGQVYRLKGEAPEISVVQTLRGSYKADELPADARIITCGVDVQKEQLFYAVRAWGVGSTSWLLRHGELWGETDQQAVWDDLAQLLEQVWGDKRIRLTLVDSGYRPDPVYALARRFAGRLYPSKGHADQSKPVQIMRIELDKKGKTSRQGTAVAHIDSNYFKSYVHGRITWPLDQPGAWHLPTDATDDYCEQIVAESRVTKSNGSVVWVQDGKKANHYLDCEALNAAAAYIRNVHLLRPGKPAAASGEPAQAQQTIQGQRPARPADPRQTHGRGRGNWATRW